MAKAVKKYVRLKPRKAREVTDLIRGLKVDEALSVLEFSPRKAARFISDTVKSAVANAEHNEKAELSSLIVKEAKVDDGPIVKPYRIKNVKFVRKE